MKLHNLLAVKTMQFYADFGHNKTNLSKGRKHFEQLCSLGYKPKLKNITNHKIKDTKVRYYHQCISLKAPVLIFFHGGGFALGNINSHDTLCRRIAKYCNINILSIEYSLAPESKYPAQINEGEEVIKMLIDNRPGYISRGPLLIGGDSAGGNIAAALAAKFNIDMELLIMFYPMLDLHKERPSIIKNGIKSNFLTTDMLRFFKKQYLSSSSDTKSYSVSPIYVNNRNLITTFIAVGELDPLIDESIDYTKRLKSADVAKKLIIKPRTIHGFMQLPRSYGYASVLSELKLFIKANNIWG